jgi:hypothetical protein
MNLGQSVQLIAGKFTHHRPAKWALGAKPTFKNTKDQSEDWSFVFCLPQKVAEPTGLEPATSDVTGRRSNQLNYDSG